MYVNFYYVYINEDIYGRRCNQIAELCFPISYKEEKKKTCLQSTTTTMQQQQQSTVYLLLVFKDNSIFNHLSNVQIEFFN